MCYVSASKKSYRGCLNIVIIVSVSLLSVSYVYNMFRMSIPHQVRAFRLYNEIKFTKTKAVHPENTEVKCRSLFSISDVPKEEFYVGRRDSGYSSYSSLNFTGNTFRRFPPIIRRPTSEVNRDLLLAKAVIRRLIKKKRTSVTTLTEEYHKLSLLLPRLLFFDTSKVNNDKNNQSKENPPKLIPHLMGSSRITAAGGMLPYVPCTIALHNDPMAIVSCIEKRIQRKGYFRIHFMGDSKIRDLLSQMLRRLDGHYKFVVSYENTTEEWNNTNTRNLKMKTDMQIISSTEPRLHIGHSFRTFSETIRSNMANMLEVTELRKWASSEEVSPDILIIGYSSWMLYNMSWVKKSISEALDYLQDVHRMVIPILEKISQKTRVLVLPQARFRRVASWHVKVTQSSLADALYDWNEAVFLYELRRFREKSGSKSGRNSRGMYNPAKASREQSKTKETMGLSSYEKGTLLPTNSSHQSSNSEVQNSALPVPSPRTIQRHSFLTENDNISKHSNNITNEQPTITNEAFQDHLIPSATANGGLWWWDTSLPLNLAGISECEQIYRRETVASSLEYNAELHCDDPHHAGRITNRDLITMLLNLMCNSVLGAQDDYCCS